MELVLKELTQHSKELILEELLSTVMYYGDSDNYDIQEEYTQEGFAGVTVEMRDSDDHYVLHNNYHGGRRAVDALQNVKAIIKRQPIIIHGKEGVCGNCGATLVIESSNSHQLLCKCSKTVLINSQP